MKYKTLGDLVDEALNEYSPPKGKWGKIKESIENLMIKHYPKIIIGTSITFGIMGYYSMMNIIGAQDLMKYLANENLSPTISATLQYQAQLIRLCGAGLGLGVGYLASTLTIQYMKGKKVYSKIKARAEKKKKKAKIFKYPKTLAGLFTITYKWDLIKTVPAQINTLIQASKIIGPSIKSDPLYHSLIKNTTFNIALTAFYFTTATFLFNLLRDVETSNQKGLKQLSDFFRYFPIKTIGLFSKEKQIRMLKKAADNNNSEYLDYLLTKAMLKKDIEEGLIYCKNIMENIKKGEKKEFRLETFKKLTLGILSRSIQKEKEQWLGLLELTIKIYRENPDAANKIIEHVRRAMPEERIDIHYFLNYLSEEIMKNSQEENWNKLAKKLQTMSNDNQLIQEFQSSEGRTWVYTGSKIINTSLVSKERDLDYLERLVKQKFEYDSLLKSGIKTEKPLGFFEEGQKLYALTTRVGKTTLREVLEDKNKDEKRKAFEKVIDDAIKSQQILFERLRKENGNYFMDAELGNRKYSAKLEVLNLEQQLLQRAFIGDNKRKNRFGVNEHLEPLLKKISIYMRENYSPLILTVNHGDLFTTNITEAYARIDARHVLVDATYDITYLALDPVFLEISRDEKAEIAFKKMNCFYECQIEKFKKSFDYLYLHNGLGLSASQQAHGFEENSALILNEVISIIKETPFEKEMLLYLNNSNAKSLIKIM